MYCGNRKNGKDSSVATVETIELSDWHIGKFLKEAVILVNNRRDVTPVHSACTIPSENTTLNHYVSSYNPDFG